METRECSKCKQSFEVSASTLNMLKRLELPLPTMCPYDRRIRRLIYRNDRKLYRRKCDLCNQPIISTYEQNAPFPVYCNSCWWSDKWKPDIFARDFNFNKPFFDQWHELNCMVPHIALWQIQNDNSEFTHDTSHNKDCYMIFGADYNRNAYYSWSTIYSKDVCDCAALTKCERVYEGTDCVECQFVYYSQIMRNCSDCFFCFDMVNCHNCFGSAGLRNKSFYFYNEPLTQEEYKKKFNSLEMTQKNIWEYIKKSYTVSLKVPRRYVIQKNCEESVGSYLGNCKSVNEGFDCEECRDVENSVLAYESKDIRDCEIVFYNGEVCYESQTLIKNCFMNLFSYFLRDAKEVSYCNECYASQKLFGCVGLRQKKFCILNKQYTADEYNDMTKKIINYMKDTKEYGEFFPVKYTPFAYNESAAYDVCLPSYTKEEAEQHDLRWKEDNAKEYKPQTYQIPPNIKDVPDSVVNEILACSRCGKNYKISQPELGFYKANKIPIPISCFDCRHRARLLRRGPRKLFNRECAKCGLSVKTIYAPGRQETVYCEKCYLAAVY